MRAREPPLRKEAAREHAWELERSSGERSLSEEEALARTHQRLLAEPAPNNCLASADRVQALYKQVLHLRAAHAVIRSVMRDLQK